MNTFYSHDQLIDFGNYLLRHYKVQQHSSDGENTPLYQQEVSHADYENWRYEMPSTLLRSLPSRFQIGDNAVFRDPTNEKCEIPSEIIAIHFFPGKVKYDLQLTFADEYQSRIYNVDSALLALINLSE